MYNELSNDELLDKLDKLNIRVSELDFIRHVCQTYNYEFFKGDKWLEHHFAILEEIDSIKAEIKTRMEK